MDSLLSVFRRHFDEVINSTEVPTSLADLMKVHFIEIFNETKDEFFKAVFLRAFKYNISMDEAVMWLLSKTIAVLHAFIADKIMKTIEENDGDEMYKIILQEIESYILNLSQKTQERKLQHIIKRMEKENNTSLQMIEEWRELMEKITNLSIRTTGMRDSAEDIVNLVLDLIFSISTQKEKTADDQQMIEIELD